MQTDSELFNNNNKITFYFIFTLNLLNRTHKNSRTSAHHSAAAHGFPEEENEKSRVLNSLNDLVVSYLNCIESDVEIKIGSVTKTTTTTIAMYVSCNDLSNLRFNENDQNTVSLKVKQLLSAILCNQDEVVYSTSGNAEPLTISVTWHVNKHKADYPTKVTQQRTTGLTEQLFRNIPH